MKLINKKNAFYVAPYSSCFLFPLPALCCCCCCCCCHCISTKGCFLTIVFLLTMDRIRPFLQNCPACGVKGTIVANTGFSLEGAYNEWCRTMGCNLCSIRWFVCLECFGLRNHMRDRKAVRAHYIRAHHVPEQNKSTKRKRDNGWSLGRGRMHLLLWPMIRRYGKGHRRGKGALVGLFSWVRVGLGLYNRPFRT